MRSQRTRSQKQQLRLYYENHGISQYKPENDCPAILGDADSFEEAERSPPLVDQAKPKCRIEQGIQDEQAGRRIESRCLWEIPA